MIQLAFATARNETADPAALAAAGFTAVETAGVGRTFAGETLYTIVKPQAPGTGANDAGKTLLARARVEPAGEILQENGGAFATPRELWLVLESAHDPRIKIAWNAAAAQLNPQLASRCTAAMAVPTLNLRIGLVRIDRLNDEALNYAKRLAGIGFSGWMVIDPAEGDGSVDPRLESAAMIAAAISAAISAAVAPRKTTKAVAKAKA